MANPYQQETLTVLFDFAVSIIVFFFKRIVMHVHHLVVIVLCISCTYTYEGNVKALIWNSPMSYIFLFFMCSVLVGCHIPLPL